MDDGRARHHVRAGGTGGRRDQNAQNYEKMATWAAQLQSIQQLGARLPGSATSGRSGIAIATELRQLIDYHNVRVYRLQGDDLMPVAMQGRSASTSTRRPNSCR